MLEIDVMVAIAIGLSLEELIAMYMGGRFYVLQSNDRDTWYDQNGRIVWTRKNLSNVGLPSRKEWNKVRDIKSGTVRHTFIDRSLGYPVERTVDYLAPWECPDRVEDYKRIWEHYSAKN